jgi:ketopantoate reductase
LSGSEIRDSAARSAPDLVLFNPGYARYSGELGTSMYFDRMAGRTLEVEVLTGAVVASGARLSIATPLNDGLLALLRAVNGAAGVG